RQGPLRRPGDRAGAGGRAGGVADADPRPAPPAGPGGLLAGTNPDKETRRRGDKEPESSFSLSPRLLVSLSSAFLGPRQPRGRGPAGLGVRGGAGGAAAVRRPGTVRDADVLADRRPGAVVGQRARAGGDPPPLHRRR